MNEEGVKNKIAVSKGLLLRPLGNILYFNPPINIEKQYMDYMLEKCKESIEGYFMNKK